MKTEIILNVTTRNDEIITSIVQAQVSRLLTEDAVFPTAQINASLIALQSKIERVEIDEQNNIRKIYIGPGSHEELLLG
jgi:hypothetical protein